MIKKLLFIFLIIMFAVPAFAANKYVRQGASGSTGNDWTNAYTTLSAAQTGAARGDTIYVASGSYAGVTFNKATSGTALITIKGATVSDHGTDTGWSSSYSVSNSDGGSQASFTSTISFTTSYWVFDGIVGNAWDQTAANYGFRITNTAYALRVYNTSTAISNVTIGHVAADAPSGDTEKSFCWTDNSTKNVTNVLVHHCRTSGWQSFIWATSAGLTMDSWTAEYNTILQQWGSAANHAESINNGYSQMTNMIIRYNWFEGYSATGITAVIVANNNSVPGIQIYGNVFKNVYGSNGVISGTSAGNLVSPKIYNNTFIDADNGGSWIGTNVTGSPLIQNNLLYSMSAGGTGGNYNAYFSCTNLPTETNRYSATGSPFVSSTDAHLTSSVSTAMTAGTSLSSPYNMDVEGNTRGSDGKWDRGAYEYVAGAPTQWLVTASVSGGNGTASCVSPVNNGATTTCTAVPNSGYRTSSMSGAGGSWTSGNNYTTGVITNNSTVTVTFTPDVYIITPSQGVHTHISPYSTQTVTSGLTTAFTVTCDAGYTCAATGCGGALAGTTFTTGPASTNCTWTSSANPNSYTIGGTIYGLMGGGVTLRNNGGNDLNRGSNGVFTFTIPLPIGTTYNVTLYTGPQGETCVVSNGSGTVGSSNVTSVVVTCSYIVHLTASTGCTVVPSTPYEYITGGSSYTANITADSGYSLTSVGGTCSGNLIGNTYTTTPTSDCTVIPNCTPVVQVEGNVTVGSGNDITVGEGSTLQAQ